VGYLKDGSIGPGTVSLPAVLALSVRVLEASKVPFSILVSCRLGGEVGIITSTVRMGLGVAVVGLVQ